MKVRSIFVVIAVIALLVISGCSFKHEEKVSDAVKFKNEYEEVNGKDAGNGNTYRTLEISEDNPIVYASCNDILNMIDSKGTFVVYFGFNTCPWCRSMISNLLEVSKELGIEKIYYVDVKDIRDKYVVNKEGKVVLEKEGSEGYISLLMKFNDILDDYSVYSDGIEYATNEKRIYAPNLISVVNGKAEKLESGISEGLEDPYGKLSEEDINNSKEKIKCVLKCLKNSNSCSANKAC